MLNKLGTSHNTRCLFSGHVLDDKFWDICDMITYIAYILCAGKIVYVMYPSVQQRFVIHVSYNYSSKSEHFITICPLLYCI